MITTGDALEIMTVVAACHPRTAPRMDDEQVALATATVWTELLEEYDFSRSELIAAVKTRAKGIPEAPEIADLIRVARAARSDQMARTPAAQSELNDQHLFPGDWKAADDTGEYPREWTSEQRIQAYWYALTLNAMPSTDRGWWAVLEQVEERNHRRAEPETRPQSPSDAQNHARPINHPNPTPTMRER